MSFQRDIDRDATLQNINDSPEDISKKAQGHKANLSNPRMCAILFTIALPSVSLSF
jgi:hypothetical protein